MHVHQIIITMSNMYEGTDVFAQVVLENHSSRHIQMSSHHFPVLLHSTI